MARHLIRGVALTLVSTAGLAAGPQAPASAVPGTILDQICYLDEVCMFEDDDYYGDKYVFYAANTGDREIGGWNGDNEISSVKNRSAYYLCLYADDAQDGDWIRLSPGQYVSSLGASYDFNDEAESFRLTTGNC